MNRAASLALVLSLAGCVDELDRNLARADELIRSSTDATSDGSGTAAATQGLTGDGESGQPGATSGETSTGDTTAGETSGDGGSSSAGEAPAPTILAVDIPGKVTMAGPVPFKATTEHASSAHAKLDGVDLGALTDEGGGVFSGVVAIYGAVDNGAHILEVIAEREELAAHRSVDLAVSAPAPGTPAWTMAGPAGSRTLRLALTPEGDVIEVGTLVIAGVARPVIRKRSAVNGAELWPEGTIVLDDRQGAAVDVTVAPDGRLWVAMNVREAANKWRPRIVLLDAAGHFAGVELPSEPGQTVRAIDGDGTGGCFAVGSAPTGLTDTDIVYWRMNGNLVPLISGKLWDYSPAGEDPHTYTDLAADVVVRDGVAWLAGASTGIHGDPNSNLHTRGLALRLDLDTTAVLGPVIIAAQSGVWEQSVFLGAAEHPDGVLVAGMACTKDCDVQRIEAALYTAGGARAWHYVGATAPVAYGSALALNAHGKVIIASTALEGATLRGRLLERVVGSDALGFELPLPASQEPSELTDVVIDAYDRIAAGGYRTFGGVTEARLQRVHP